VSELCSVKGFADVHAVLNCTARLSHVLRPVEDPGVVCGGGSGPGAPYSKAAAKKIKVRCTNWERGCEVSSKSRKKTFDVHHSCASSPASR
jgi:hypothetical protein